MQTTELYIDGAFVAPQAGGGLEAINPATETVFARINCLQPTFTQAPWGGYKSFGIGRELGTAGFMGFREIKQITRYDHTRTSGWYLKP